MGVTSFSIASLLLASITINVLALVAWVLLGTRQRDDGPGRELRPRVGRRQRDHERRLGSPRISVRQ